MTCDWGKSLQPPLLLQSGLGLRRPDVGETIGDAAAPAPVMAERHGFALCGIDPRT